MTRTYYTDCPTTAADSEPLDAWTARTRLHENLSAVYESNLFDQTVVLDAYETITVATWYYGPLPVLMRWDRNGHWRDIEVDLLAAGGGDTAEFRVVLTDYYGRPYSGGVAGAPDGTDPYVDFTVTSGTTLDWQGEQTIDGIDIGSTWNAQQYRRPTDDGTEQGLFRLAWLSIWMKAAPSNARFGGIRYYEVVDDEDGYYGGGGGA